MTSGNSEGSLPETLRGDQVGLTVDAARGSGRKGGDLRGGEERSGEGLDGPRVGRYIVSERRRGPIRDGAIACPQSEVSLSDRRALVRNDVVLRSTEPWTFGEGASDGVIAPGIIEAFNVHGRGVLCDPTHAVGTGRGVVLEYAVTTVAPLFHVEATRAREVDHREELLADRLRGSGSSCCVGSNEWFFLGTPDRAAEQHPGYNRCGDLRADRTELFHDYTVMRLLSLSFSASAALME